MTVLEFIRSFDDMASDREYQLKVRQNPGDGSSKLVYSGSVKDEIYMRPSVRNAEIWKWIISAKNLTIVIVVRSIVEKDSENNTLDCVECS